MSGVRGHDDQTGSQAHKGNSKSNNHKWQPRLAVQTVPTETVILSRPDSIKIKTFGVPDQDQTKTLHI